MKTVDFTTHLNDERIAAQARLLDDRGTYLVTQIQQLLLDECDIDRATHLFARLTDLSETRQLLRELQACDEGEDGVPVFTVSSELLHRAYHVLSETNTETILYASGSRYGSVYTVERLVPIKMERSEMTYAAADPASSSEALRRMDQYGSLLTCYLHAHPGKGANANHPSGIDIQNHARLEQGGFRTVGGIFSRDGFVRFFSDKMPFRVVVSGKGVEDVGTNSWKLETTSDLYVH